MLWSISEKLIFSFIQPALIDCWRPTLCCAKHQGNRNRSGPIPAQQELPLSRSLRMSELIKAIECDRSDDKKMSCGSAGPEDERGQLDQASQRKQCSSWAVRCDKIPDFLKEDDFQREETEHANLEAEKAWCIQRAETSSIQNKGSFMYSFIKQIP